MNPRITLLAVGMCLSFATLKSIAAPVAVPVTDVGLDGSNNVTSVSLTSVPVVITPANLIGSTADLSNVSRVFNGSGVAPASVVAAQPYAGDLSLLTGLQDIGATDYLKFTFNAPINTVNGNVDFVFMHARAQNPGISFQALDTFGADIPGALISAPSLTDINKGSNPANWFYGPLPSLAVIGNFPQHAVFAEAVGFGFTGTIGGVKVILGSPTGSPVVPGGTIEVYEALGITGVPAPIDTNFDDLNDTDIGDFHILRSNFLTGTTHAQGDANFDLVVNHQDFFLWRSAFLSGGGNAAAIDWSPVPEPSTCVLFLTCGLTIACVRRTSRRICK